MMGVIIWALLASSAAALRPESVAEWLVSTHPLQIAGMLMISIGLCGGFADGVHLAAIRWAEPEENELTEVPWDE